MRKSGPAVVASVPSPVGEHLRGPVRQEWAGKPGQTLQAGNLLPLAPGTRFAPDGKVNNSPDE
jgi:hypothetical protein